VDGVVAYNTDAQTEERLVTQYAKKVAGTLPDLYGVASGPCLVWRSDGTPAGTTEVEIDPTIACDLFPGPGDRAVVRLTTGQHLLTDGTEAGTQLAPFLDNKRILGVAGDPVYMETPESPSP